MHWYVSCLYDSAGNQHITTTATTTTTTGDGLARGGGKSLMVMIDIQTLWNAAENQRKVIGILGIIYLGIRLTTNSLQSWYEKMAYDKQNKSILW